MAKPRSKREQVIARLKRDARKHFRRASLHDDLDCGRHLQDAIRGTDTEGHALEYERCVKRLSRIDPHFPEGVL